MTSPRVGTIEPLGRKLLAPISSQKLEEDRNLWCDLSTNQPVQAANLCRSQAILSEIDACLEPSSGGGIVQT